MQRELSTRTESRLPLKAMLKTKKRSGFAANTVDNQFFPATFLDHLQEMTKATLTDDITSEQWTLWNARHSKLVQDYELSLKDKIPSGSQHVCLAPDMEEIYSSSVRTQHTSADHGMIETGVCFKQVHYWLIHLVLFVSSKYYRHWYCPNPICPTHNPVHYIAFKFFTWDFPCYLSCWNSSRQKLLFGFSFFVLIHCGKNKISCRANYFSIIGAIEGC